MERRKFVKQASAAGLVAASGPLLSSSIKNQKEMNEDRTIHDKMILLDGCCPLLSWGIDPMSGSVDKATLGKGPALYIEGGVTAAGASVGGTRTPVELTRTSLKLHNQMIEDNGWIKVKITADVLRAKREKTFGIWYLFQGAFAVEDNLDLLEEFKENGVGQVAPAYNYRNRFASGQLDRSDAGLSMAGVDLIKKCNELRIIVDGVHNSDKDVFDMIEFSSSPVIISHSNAKAVYNHPRNVPDDLIKAIGQKGGVVGAVGWPTFVSESQFPTFDQFFAHIEHIIEVAGIDHASIGMDYFAMSRGLMEDDVAQKLYDQIIASGVWTAKEYGRPPYVYPTGLATPATFYNITNGLLSRGYSVEDTQKVMGGNLMRVMKEVWG
ncbi:MAG: membrane dipeptidase [Halioglobus sp.]|nr:membrane dipeptidase [Halioglobus sp.]